MCGGVGVFGSLHVCVSVCMLRLCIPYLNVQDRASQIAAIENSFEQAKQPVSCYFCEAGHLLALGREEEGRKEGGRERVAVSEMFPTCPLDHQALQQAWSGCRRSAAGVPRLSGTNVCSLSN